MSSSIVFQPNLRTKGMPGASKLLFVIIRAALFCNFCKWFFQLDHSSPTWNSNNENEVLQCLRIVYLRFLKAGYLGHSLVSIYIYKNVLYV